MKFYRSISTRAGRLPKTIIILASIVLASLLTPLLFISYLHASPPEVLEDISYGTHASQRLDVCLSKASVHPAAIVVLFHGGGWKVGDKRTLLGTCRFLAAKGFLVATSNYRLSGDSTDSRWPTQIVDAELAIRFIRSHATDFGGDAERLCVVGESAGAHLATMLALGPITIEYEPNGLAVTTSPIRCAVDEWGPTDLTAPSLQNLVRPLLGDSSSSSLHTREQRISPLYNVNPKSAPILIVAGLNDALVQRQQVEAFSEALIRNGVPTETIWTSGGHGWHGLPVLERESIVRSVVQFIIKWTMGGSRF